MTEPTEKEAKPKERASLLARGIGLLLLSGVATLVLPSISGGGDNRGRLMLAWAGQAAFWLGLICVAGYVLAEVLRGGRAT
jgi:hypothetical protein